MEIVAPQAHAHPGSNGSSGMLAMNTHGGKTEVQPIETVGQNVAVEIKILKSPCRDAAGFSLQSPKANSRSRCPDKEEEHAQHQLEQPKAGWSGQLGCTVCGNRLHRFPFGVWEKEYFVAGHLQGPDLGPEKGF